MGNHIPIIQVLGKVKQKDHAFKIILSYVMISCFRKQIINLTNENSLYVIMYNNF